MYLFATMLFALLASAPAYAVECRTSWEADGHWYWRMIDERKCWYQGHRLIPKDDLHWPQKQLAGAEQPPSPAQPWPEKPRPPNFSPFDRAVKRTLEPLQPAKSNNVLPVPVSQTNKYGIWLNQHSLDGFDRRPDPHPELAPKSIRVIEIKQSQGVQLASAAPEQVNTIKTAAVKAPRDIETIMEFIWGGTSALLVCVFGWGAYYMRRLPERLPIGCRQRVIGERRKAGRRPDDDQQTISVPSIVPG